MMAVTTEGPGHAPGSALSLAIAARASADFARAVHLAGIAAKEATDQGDALALYTARCTAARSLYELGSYAAAARASRLALAVVEGGGDNVREHLPTALHHCFADLYAAGRAGWTVFLDRAGRSYGIDHPRRPVLDADRAVVELETGRASEAMWTASAVLERDIPADVRRRVRGTLVLALATAGKRLDGVAEARRLRAAVEGEAAGPAASFALASAGEALAVLDQGREGRRVLQGALRLARVRGEAGVAGHVARLLAT